MILASLAFATSGFDATTPDANFTDAETYDNAGDIKLWAVIERLHDPDPELFSAGDWNDATTWADSADWAPHIGEMFGTGTPNGSDALLHVGPSSAISYGTPILFVPGAADNASRGFITMAWHEDLLKRPVFAITFAHPHGDVFEQAELVADAIARIKQRTGATQVDVVSHSKGGAATAVYLANSASASWSDEAYERLGTTYRGDVRRAVFIATPLGGIDTAFRWPLSNLYGTDATAAFAPVSWQTYYPYTTSVPASAVDLRTQDFYADNGDLFPGQRQLLARQDDYDLPGSMSWLGAYSLQPDWYTTYEGGWGFYSYSDGIDAAIAAGGSVMEQVQQNGVDAAVTLFVLAGENPLMPNGTSDWVAATFGEEWAEVPAAVESWAELTADLVGNGLMSVGITEEEVQGLAVGDLILGEVSGASDGLVFVSSATKTEVLTSGGAELKETKVANLSHLDLLYASPITGELMLEAAAADESMSWYKAFGDRYIEADTIGWVEDALADDETPVDTGDTGTIDTGDTGLDTGDTGATEDSGTKDSDGTGANPDDDEATPGCGACNAGPGATPWLGLVGLLFLGRRRR